MSRLPLFFGTTLTLAVGLLALIRWKAPSHGSDLPAAHPEHNRAHAAPSILPRVASAGTASPEEKHEFVPAESSAASPRQPTLNGSPTASARNARVANPGTRPHVAVAAQYRELTERKTALFFEVVNVDAATREALLRAVADHSLEDRDITQAAREMGLSMEEMSKLRLEPSRKYRQRVVDLLGEEAGSYFLDLTSASWYMPVVDEFAKRCAAAGQPLGPHAKASLAINFMNNLENPEIPRAKVLLPNGVSVWEDKAFKDAQKVLSAQQMELFKKLWSEKPYPTTGD